MDRSGSSKICEASKLDSESSGTRRADQGGGLVDGGESEREALAAAWPRALIAEGVAEVLSDWWIEGRRAAAAAGLPAIPRHPMNPTIADGLFEVRRARRLVRGLEGAESQLVSEEAGLRKVARTAPGPGPKRISRLLIVSADGSKRFYHQVEKLRLQFENRLEVLLLDCDDEILGRGAFGPGTRSRAMLIDHKDALIRFLALLLEEIQPEAGSPSSG
jgi:hypothetical protein